MKRRYSSENRDAQAAKTRSQILQAAKELFSFEGFDRVTINMLAEAAGVSMPTIYAVFKSKRGVLQSLIDEALPKKQFESLVKEAMEAKSLENHLRASAKIARHIYDAEKELMVILCGASVVAPEIKELEQEREQRRYKRQGDGLKSWIKGPALQNARDTLWALTGRDIYRLMVLERGWSSDKYEKWLAELLVTTLA